MRRMFKAKMGFGVSNYIDSCRLSNAIPLLREGLPISTVALKTGFGSDTYFISTFKKIWAFRLKNTSNKDKQEKKRWTT
ncbi:MAG: helix-turn-helix domain-containing protein [Christensenellaceae bacterium]